MAGKCAECGEKVGLMRRYGQYVGNTWLEFCSAEHREAYQKKIHSDRADVAPIVNQGGSRIVGIDLSFVDWVGLIMKISLATIVATGLLAVIFAAVGAAVLQMFGLENPFN